MTITQPPPINPAPVHLASPTVTAPSPQHLEQIAAARKLGKPITRCARVAGMSAWTIVLFGALTVITSLTSAMGMILGVGMCIISHFEFRGARDLRRLNPDAPKHLARNQLILGTLLLIYSVVSLWSALTHPSELQQALGSDAQLSSMVGSITSLERMAYITLYSAMIAAAILGCGGTALYYARRRQHIENYVRQTPSWIIELQRAGMSVY